MKRKMEEIVPNPTAGVAADFLYTPRGSIYLQGPVAFEEMGCLHMDEGLDKFRLPEEQKKVLDTITLLPEGRVFVARRDHTIIGYITFHLPEYPRWAQSGIQGLIELGGLEVSRYWRGMGVGQALLDYTFLAHDFEDYIVISIETYCNWDLKGSGMNLWEYRRMLEKVLGRVGLERWLTDDQEITDHPANMLTARVGNRVNAETRSQFEKLLFLRRHCN
jgi:acetoin utilization protein AcuA